MNAREKFSSVVKGNCYNCGHANYILLGIFLSCRPHEGICEECDEVIYWTVSGSIELDWSKDNVADQIPDCPDWLRQMLRTTLAADGHKQIYMDLRTGMSKKDADFYKKRHMEYGTTKKKEIILALKEGAQKQLASVH